MATKRYSHTLLWPIDLVDDLKIIFQLELHPNLDAALEAHRQVPPLTHWGIEKNGPFPFRYTYISTQQEEKGGPQQYGAYFFPADVTPKQFLCLFLSNESSWLWNTEIFIPRYLIRQAQEHPLYPAIAVFRRKNL